jgi:hypothetical protein
MPHEYVNDWTACVMIDFIRLFLFELVFQAFCSLLVSSVVSCLLILVCLNSLDFSIPRYLYLYVSSVGSTLSLLVLSISSSSSSSSSIKIAWCIISTSSTCSQINKTFVISLYSNPSDTPNKSLIPKNKEIWDSINRIFSCAFYMRRNILQHSSLVTTGMVLLVCTTVWFNRTIHIEVLGHICYTSNSIHLPILHVRKCLEFHAVCTFQSFVTAAEYNLPF